MSAKIPAKLHFAKAGLIVAALLAAGQALATEAGLRRFVAPAQSSSQESINVALFYPTQDGAKPIPMGPFTPKYLNLVLLC